MSLAVLYSRALSGMDAELVTVEVHLANGLPGFTIVGLPETEVKESRDRVRAAIQNCQFEFPTRRITVNLAPADLPKESGRFDLPIALGILAASGQLPANSLEPYEYAGELALTGELRPIRGALAMTYRASHCGRAFILPQANGPEAALVNDAIVLPAHNLLQVAAHLRGLEPLVQYHPQFKIQTPNYPDMAEVKGQGPVKRGLEIAAVGSHSVLLSGPPGTGKSMLAGRFPGILPPMTQEEALATAALQSLDRRFELKNWAVRPFRAPHHTASAVALVGGGSFPRPGEISMALNGVLFLDELPEFDRKVLEVLREPMESGQITISRANQRADFPARFQFIAAMNPCPCGYLGHFNQRCRCTPDQINRYRNKISGPLLDRIDLQIEVPALPAEQLLDHTQAESSTVIQQRVIAARQRQLQRQGKANNLLTVTEIEQYCRPDNSGQQLLQQAIQQLNLSARAYHRVLKVARSIADLANAAQVQVPHIAEAIRYRRGLE